MKKKITVLAGIAVFVLALGVMAQAQDKPANVAGAWDLSAPGRGGEVATQPMTIEQTGGDIKGALKGGRGDVPLEGAVKGNEIMFTVTRQGRGGEVKLEYKGTVEGDTMKGTVMMGGNSVNWTAARGK